jgi:hypothetical protein
VDYRKPALIKNLIEKKVGKALKVKTNVNGLGNFIRVDVRNVLARVVTISRDKKREFYQIQYEKIPRFCGACGYFGHSHLECGTGEHEEEHLKWGDFLKADWETWHGRGSTMARGGGRGSNASRGGGGREGDRGRGREPLISGANRTPLGRGRGDIKSWRYNAIAYVEGQESDPDMKDTAISPAKDMDTDKTASADSIAKRRLEMGDALSTSEADIIDEGSGKPEDMVTDGYNIPPLIATDVMNDRAKRSKKDGANSTSQGSAASLEEFVRSQ